MKQSEQSRCQIISTGVKAVFKINFITVFFLIFEGQGPKHGKIGPCENFFANFGRKWSISEPKNVLGQIL